MPVVEFNEKPIFWSALDGSCSGSEISVSIHHDRN